MFALPEITSAGARGKCSMKRIDHMGLLSPVSVVPGYGKSNIFSSFGLYCLACHIGMVVTIDTKRITTTKPSVYFLGNDDTAIPPKTERINTATDKKRQGN